MDANFGLAMVFYLPSSLSDIVRREHFNPHGRQRTRRYSSLLPLMYVFQNPYGQIPRQRTSDEQALLRHRLPFAR